MAAGPSSPMSRESRVTPRTSRQSDSSGPSRVDVELAALEDQALREVDAVSLLRDAGIDVDKLRKRPDADDFLRHVAADELLTRAFMRDLLSTTIYPYGYSRDQAMYDARVAADRLMAALSPEARAEALSRAVADGSKDLPVPTFYGEGSGRTYSATSDAESGEAP
jgi:hypothetical protein